MKAHTTPRQRLVKRLDCLLHDIVVLKYSRCVTCGSTDDPETGHLITRGALSVKYDLINLARQCHTCNMIHEIDKQPFTDWFLRTYGEHEYAELNKRANQGIHSIKLWQLSVIEEELKTIKAALMQKDAVANLQGI